MIKIAKNWFEILRQEFEKPYFKSLQNFLSEEYGKKTIYPQMDNIFNALNYTKFEDVKVVIFGQDPYHGPGQAHGLAFSVLDGVALPPSLKNIFKEIEDELNIKCFDSGNLARWARQGVLLLNTVLTVEQSKPNSHKNKGWEIFTQEIVKKLSMREDKLIFVLWGANARVFEPLISPRHVILKSAHPSPLSAFNGFFGNGHFAKINQILIEENKTPIDWR